MFSLPGRAKWPQQSTSTPLRSMAAPIRIARRGGEGVAFDPSRCGCSGPPTTLHPLAHLASAISPSLFGALLDRRAHAGKPPGLC